MTMNLWNKKKMVEVERIKRNCETFIIGKDKITVAIALLSATQMIRAAISQPQFYNASNAVQAVDSNKLDKEGVEKVYNIPVDLI